MLSVVVRGVVVRGVVVRYCAPHTFIADPDPELDPNLILNLILNPNK